MIEIAVGQHDALNGRVTGGPRVQRREGFDLLSYFRRRTNQILSAPICAHRHRFLCAGLGLQAAIAQARAIRAPTVPLREASARSRAEHANQQDQYPFELPPLPIIIALNPVEIPAVEVTLVGADFGIHFDLDKGRCFPEHVDVSLSIPSRHGASPLDGGHRAKPRQAVGGKVPVPFRGKLDSHY